jgi:hypothetical protein
LAQYRFTGDQTQVFCGLQADDGSTLVATPGQVVEIAELHDSLAQFFQPVAKKTAAAKTAAAKTAATNTIPPDTTATEGKE